MRMRGFDFALVCRCEEGRIVGRGFLVRERLFCLARAISEGCRWFVAKMRSKYILIIQEYG